MTSGSQPRQSAHRHLSAAGNYTARRRQEAQPRTTQATDFCAPIPGKRSNREVAELDAQAARGGSRDESSVVNQAACRGPAECRHWRPCVPDSESFSYTLRGSGGGSRRRRRLVSAARATRAAGTSPGVLRDGRGLCPTTRRPGVFSITAAATCAAESRRLLAAGIRAGRSTMLSMAATAARLSHLLQRAVGRTRVAPAWSPQRQGAARPAEKRQRRQPDDGLRENLLSQSSHHTAP